MLKILSFEWRYHLRHFSFPVFALFFLAFGYLLSRNAFGEANLYQNSTYNITLSVGLMSLVAIFWMMVMASRALLRDRQHQMEELILSTPVSKLHYQGSRVLGLFSVSAVIFALGVLGLWLGVVWSADGKTGPIEWSHYLWPYLLMALPNLFFTAAVLFTLASLSRNSMATYVGGILLYAFYWVGAMFVDSPLLAGSAPATAEGLSFASLLDPFGMSAFMRQTLYWEVAERNSRLIGLKGYFLYNRLIWISIGLLLLGLNYRLFQLRKNGGKRKKQVQETGEVFTTVHIPHVSIVPNNWREQLFSRLGIEWKQLFSSWPFLLVNAIWLAIVASEVLMRINGGGEYGTDLYPTTNLLIWLIEEPYGMLTALVIIFYAGEIMHRERILHFDLLTDSSPVANSALYLAKLLALCGIPFLMLASAFLLAAGFQLLEGWYALHIDEYLMGFYLYAFPLCLFAVLNLFIQSVSPNKYIGMFVALVFKLLFGSSLGAMVGLVHPLSRMGTFPTVELNNMNGYSTELEAFHWMTLFWGSLYGLLAILTYYVWKRGSITSIGDQLKDMRNRWNGASWLMVAGVFFVFLFSGSLLFYHTNILNDYEGRGEILDRKADYEKKYKALDFKMPDIVRLKSKIDLYPSERRYLIEQRYTIQNRTNEPMEEVWFTVSPQVKVIRFELENAKLITTDEKHRVYWFKWNEPLQPGEKVRMQFDIEDQHEGLELQVSVADRDIVRNGTNIMSWMVMPSFGYRYDEIQDPEERKKRGLPPLDEEPEQQEHAEVATGDAFVLESLISTEAGQRAIAPGDLIAQGERDGRVWFHYKTSRPAANLFSYISADYVEKKQEHEGVSIELYHAKGHDHNADVMLEVMTHTLDYCQEAFHSYPYDHLRMAELPAHWPMGGYATPGTIGLMEHKGFFTDLRNPQSFDVVTKRVAHEVAHQWFGHQLTPSGEGGALIVESLAKYIEFIMLEKRYGQVQVQKLLRNQMDDYFKNRNRALNAEPPLDKVKNEAFVYYAKGCIVMNALRDLLGEDRLNAAIRELFEVEPLQAADFVRILKANSSPYEIGVIDDWLSKVVTYDLKIDAVEAKPLGDGRYEVKLTVWVEKFETLASGEALSVDFEEQLSFGFESKKGKLLKKHQVKKGENKLTFILDERSESVTIDPKLTRLDKNRYDNRIVVE